MKEIYNCGDMPIRTYYIGILTEIKKQEERLKNIYRGRATYEWGEIYLPKKMTDYDGVLCCDTESKKGYGLTVTSFSSVDYFFVEDNNN